MNVGDAVIYTDEYGKKHHALLCAVHGPPDSNPSVNLVYVSDDPSKTDQYGRQIERQGTSVVHASNQGAHGRYWESVE